MGLVFNIALIAKSGIIPGLMLSTETMILLLGSVGWGEMQPDLIFKAPIWSTH